MSWGNENKVNERTVGKYKLACEEYELYFRKSPDIVRYKFSYNFT